MQNQVKNGSNSSMHIIAYITLIGLIIAFVSRDKDDDLTNYHIRQSLGLALYAVLINFIGFIPKIGWFASMAALILLVFMWIKGLMNAINQKKEPVPLLGENFNEWFKNI